MSTHCVTRWATALTLVTAVILGADNAARGQAAPKAGDSAKAKAAAKAKVVLDLNKASEQELADNLPGVGEVTAKKIVAGRPYTTVDDLAKAGVSARVIEEIRPLVTVAATPAPTAASAKTKKAAAKEKETEAKGPLDLNSASQEELDVLPGVGPVTAKKIVAGRPYKAVDDLAKAGVPVKTIEAIRSMVMVGGVPAAAAEKPASPKAAASTKAMTKKSAAATTPTAGKLVNLNTAPKEELDSLPGIGPVKAQAIMDARPFKTIEDVMKVKGIKEGEFSKIKDLITVQ